jgi:hypothetical protein
VWIAFHDVNYDMYEAWIDDVQLTAGRDDDRHLESYKVMCTSIDGEQIFNTNTTNPFCQLSTDQLVEGERYICKVAAIYSTGMSAWEEVVWQYEDCSNYAGTLNGVTVDGNTITWDYPGGGDGPTPPPTGETSFTEGFEGSLNGWNVLTVNAAGGHWLHSNNNPSGYDYASHAHGGSGFAMCYSFIDYDGAYDTDSYLYTPQKYDIVNGSTLTFFADNANDSYPESFSVCVATADNPTASDFVTVWSGSAKDKGGAKANVRHDGNRYDNWRSHTVDLSAYAGQSVWIAFHDVNYDMYEVWIDDVQLTAGAKNRANVDHFNVYRSTNNVDYVLLNTVAYVDGQTYYEYIDTPAGTGTYYYQVTTVYDNDCESDPAVNAENPANDYVMIGVTGIDENSDKVALYPNPTKGNVTIEANGMSRITVVSVLGQVVFDTELDADVYTLNMAQFNAGMYMVRVYTENGMTVKRVTVMQ